MRTSSPWPHRVAFTEGVDENLYFLLRARDFGKHFLFIHIDLFLGKVYKRLHFDEGAPQALSDGPYLPRQRAPEGFHRVAQLFLGLALDHIEDRFGLGKIDSAV